MSYLRAYSRVWERPLAEMALIGLWAMWVGRALINFDLNSWPNGREWGVHLTPYFFWTQLKSCGLCALWSGSINGGMPALADAFGSTLHPLIALPVLIWGVPMGAKMAVVGALWLGGVAQWWIARILGLGRVARLWSALAAVVGGHLLTPMEPGELAMVISIAATSLALAAALELALNRKRHSALLLALFGALAIVAGHGYAQLGLLFWGPAFCLLILDRHLRPTPVWKEFALALLLCLLLASVFLVPMLHFSPNFTKPADPQFAAGQTLEYLPLNLVIRDWEFQHTQILGKLPYPVPLFVGWVPVLLALVCLSLARRSDLNLLLCLAVGAGTMLFVASGVPLRWLATLFPSFAWFRHSILIAALAVPGILGLSAYGLHRLWCLGWPNLSFERTSPSTGKVSQVVFKFEWLLLIPLVWSLQISYNYSQSFLGTISVRDLRNLVSEVTVSGLQWVSLDSTDNAWIGSGLEHGLKLTEAVFPAGWSNRANPPRHLLLYRSNPPEGAKLIGTVRDWSLYQFPLAEYASVELSNGRRLPCQASGGGGQIQVICDIPESGVLAVKENSWTGWRVWQDGTPVALINDQWLQVNVPPGHHEFLFNYLPWDVPLGLVISLIGACTWWFLWRRARANHTAMIVGAPAH